MNDSFVLCNLFLESLSIKMLSKINTKEFKIPKIGLGNVTSNRDMPSPKTRPDQLLYAIICVFII